MTDALWYKDAVIYEVHVRAFFDSNDDGIGDFGGLIRKLDYIQELGVNTIWLLPFYPSPGKDDGYDISDYRNIHPAYGTREDFKAVRRRGASSRPARDHRAGHQSHLGSASVVPGRPQGAARAQEAQLLRVVGRSEPVRRHAHHLHGYRAVELDAGPALEAVLLAPLLQPPARPELRQSARRAAGARRS